MERAFIVRVSDKVSFGTDSLNYGLCQVPLSDILSQTHDSVDDPSILINRVVTTIHRVTGTVWYTMLNNSIKKGKKKKGDHHFNLLYGYFLLHNYPLPSTHYQLGSLQFHVPITVSVICTYGTSFRYFTTTTNQLVYSRQTFSVSQRKRHIFF